MNYRSVSARRSTRTLVALLTATVSATTLISAHAPLAQAQESAANLGYAIPAGPLPQALNRFADISGLQLVYDASATRLLRTGGFNGSGSASGVLSALLSGTGLTWRFTNANTVTITNPVADVQTPTVDGAIVLQPVTIRVDGIDDWTTPPEYAGGQVASGAKLGMLGNTSIMDAPFNVTSYTSNTIKKQQAVTIADVVANDPSVRVYTNGMGSSAGVGDSFFIRGFSVGNYSVLIDGYGGIAPDRIIPVETMESVEILKGPNALLNGYTQYGSLGGSINVVPKRATDTPVTSVTTSYASDSQFGTHLDYGRRFGHDKEWGVRFNGIFRNGDTSINGQSARLGVATVALDYRGDNLRASLDAGHIDQKTQSPTGAAGFGFASGIPAPRVPDLASQIYQDWEYSGTKSDYILGKVEYDLNPSWTVYGGAGYRRYNQEALSTDIYVTDAAGNATATAYYSPIREHALSAQAGIRGEFETGSIGHKVNFNTSYLFQSMDQLSNYYGFYSFDTNIYDATTVARPSTAGFSSHPPKYWDVRAPSLTLADTMSFLDGRVLFTAGLRYQKIKVDVFNPDGSLSQGYDKKAVTPVLGLVFKPVDNLSIYANYIEGLQRGPVAWAGTANAGEIFPPIMTEQLEAGVKYDFGTFTTTASIFQITRPGSILTTDASGATVFSVDGEQRNRGIELNFFGEATAGLRLLGGLAYTQGTLTRTDNGLNDGNSAVGVPRWQGNIGVEWDPKSIEGLTLSGRMIATSAQYADQANEQEVSGWSRFDMGAQYRIDQFGNPWTVRASVENVTNRDYWAGVSDGWVTMGTPRTFKLSATVDF